MLTFTTKYVPMSDKIFNFIAEKISESYPNACILSIDEVVNDNLATKFIQTKLSFERDPDITFVEEKKLFHGTSVENISSICAEGFKKDMNIVSAYGKGTYFSSQASFSWAYMKTKTILTDNAKIAYMFLADILIPHYSSTKSSITCQYINNDQIVVVPNDNFIYPRYIITFHANATK